MPEYPGDASLPTSFTWPQTASLLRAFGEVGSWRITEDGAALAGEFGGRPLRFEPPLLQPLAGFRTQEDWRASLEELPGLHLVLLVRAGTSAMGLWKDHDLLRHKVIRKYVVRGKGRAQPLHLKTQGKSRYGSRLRLRNAREQLEETNEKLTAWRNESGAFRLTFVSCPVRTLPELFAVKPPPPFPRDAILPVPHHVHTPNLEELQRIHRLLSRGRVLEAT